MLVGVVNRREHVSTDTDDPMAGHEVTEVAAVLIPENQSVVSEPVKLLPVKSLLAPVKRNSELVVLSCFTVST